MSLATWRIPTRNSLPRWHIRTTYAYRWQSINCRRFITSHKQQTKERSDDQLTGRKSCSAQATSTQKGEQQLEQLPESTKDDCPGPSTSRSWAANDANEYCPSSSKSKLLPQQMRENVQGYMLTRFFDHVKNYDKVLEKNFPSAMKVYRVFFDGVRDFYSDMKSYVKISRIVHTSPKGLKALNRKELELYMRMPRDMIKVAPALIGSSLPMIGYVIFPIVFMYPRIFLTSHFWSLQQRTEFQQMKVQERLRYNRDVFRLLQGKLRTVEAHEKHEQLEYICGLIGSGFHPSIEAILDVRDIFSQPPYSLQSLNGKHLKYLTQLHGLRGGVFKRHRLTEHAFLVHHMDMAIRREGDVHNMLPEALRYSCYIRGLNPTNLRDEEMIDWLRTWITVSTAIQIEHISLFLHLPIFLAYNHPNNWQLLHEKQKTKGQKTKEQKAKQQKA